MRRAVIGIALSLLLAALGGALGFVDPDGPRALVLLYVAVASLPAGLLALPELERRIVARRRHKRPAR